MAINLNDPTSQTFTWANGEHHSNSIYLPGFLEIVGYTTSGAFAATTTHCEFEVSRTDPNTPDASVTDWIEALRKDGTTAVEWPVSATAAVAILLLRANYVAGPIRFRLLTSTAAHGDINQDGAKVLTPIFRYRKA